MRRYWRILQTLLGLMLRHPVTGTSILGFLPNGEVVLIRRRDDGKWALPGGIVDWGETIEQDVGRELKEETGLSLVQIQQLVGVYSHPRRDPRMHSICVAVAAEVNGQFQIKDTDEVMEVRSFPLGAIPLDDLSHDHAVHVQCYLQGVPVLN
jgi:ADP-ribose pyrophosphatase YjhB (NUDIX family)